MPYYNPARERKGNGGDLLLGKSKKQPILYNHHPGYDRIAQAWVHLRWELYSISCSSFFSYFGTHLVIGVVSIFFKQNLFLIYMGDLKKRWHFIHLID